MLENFGSNSFNFNHLHMPAVPDQPGWKNSGPGDMLHFEPKSPPLYSQELTEFRQTQQWVPFVHDIIDCMLRPGEQNELINKAVLRRPEMLPA